MWMYRRLLKISWVDRITNEEMLNRMCKEIEILLFTTKKIKLEFLVQVSLPRQIFNFVKKKTWASHTGYVLFWKYSAYNLFKMMLKYSREPQFLWSRTGSLIYRIIIKWSPEINIFQTTRNDPSCNTIPATSPIDASNERYPPFPLHIFIKFAFRQVRSAFQEIVIIRRLMGGGQETNEKFEKLQTDFLRGAVGGSPLKRAKCILYCIIPGNETMRRSFVLLLRMHARRCESTGTSSSRKIYVEASGRASPPQTARIWITNEWVNLGLVLAVFENIFIIHT